MGARPAREPNGSLHGFRAGSEIPGKGPRECWLEAPMRTGTLACAVVLSAFSAACSGEADQPSSNPTIREVLSVEPAWGPGDEWSVDPMPTVQIGVEGGDRAYELSRVKRAVRLRDSSIVLAHNSSHSLRFFDPSGQFLFDAGGDGEGPGEFRHLDHLWILPGDTLVVADNSIHRIVYYSAQGQYLKQVTLDLSAETQHLPMPFAPFPGGGFLAYHGERGSGFQDAGKLIEGNLIITRFSPQGSLVQEIARLPLPDSYGLLVGNSIDFPEVPFAGAWPSVMPGPDCVFMGTGKEALVEVVDSSGTHDRNLRWTRYGRAVTSEVVAQYKSEYRRFFDSDDKANIYARYLDEIGFPDRMPVYEAILVDEGGNLWVREYAPFWEFSDGDWQVFNPDGEWLGTVSAPPRVRIDQVGDDFVVGVQYDELNVERVHLYHLNKPEKSN